MLPRIISAPFIVLPKSKWNNSMEKKPRIPVDDLLYSSSDSESDTSSVYTGADQSSSYTGTGTYDSSSYTGATSSYYTSTVTHSLENDDNQTIKSIQSSQSQVLSNKGPEASTLPPISGQADSQPDNTENTTKKFRRRPAKIISDFIKSQLRKNETYNDFQLWRAKNADARRHHLVRFYEEKVMQFDRERNEQIEQEIAANQRAVLKEIARRDAVKKSYVKRKKITSQVSDALMEKVDERKFEAEKMAYFCTNLPRWAEEGRVRKLLEDTEVRKEEEAERCRQLARQEEREKKAKRKEEARQLKQDWEESQDIIRMMRCNGSIEAVNAPPPPPRKQQHEMSMAVDLVLREDTTDFSQPVVKATQASRKERGNTFNVDLLAFKNALSVKATMIGERGALALAADFVCGACPRLEMLDLSRCEMQTRGLGRLLHGIRMGNVITIAVLILKGNFITGRGVDYLLNSMANGSLLNLTHLDLSDNEIGDEGMAAIAHGMVKGYFHQLRELRLDRNGIHDAGFSAMVKLLTSLHEEVCPDLNHISLYGNLITPAVKKSFHPLPSYILV
eukprot:gene3072-6024_t